MAFNLKRTNIFRLSILVIIILLGPSSCFIFETCPDKKDYFRIDGLRISNKSLTGDYQNKIVEIPENEQTTWRNYLIQVDFLKTYHSSIDNAAGIANLYALSCNDSGYLGSKSGIDTLYVLTVTDYNSNFITNDTINEIISINDSVYRPYDYQYFQPLDTYINENKEGINRKFFDIAIEQAPSLTSDFYQFKIIYILKDGKIFEELTPKIRLTI